MATMFIVVTFEDLFVVTTGLLADAMDSFETAAEANALAALLNKKVYLHPDLPADAYYRWGFDQGNQFNGWPTQQLAAERFYAWHLYLQHPVVWSD